MGYHETRLENKSGQAFQQCIKHLAYHFIYNKNETLKNSNYRIRETINLNEYKLKNAIREELLSS